MYLFIYLFIYYYKLIICWFISFLSYQLSEFLQSEIKQKLSSVQKITCVTAIADKEIISIFCVSGYFAPHLSLLFKLNSFFSVALFSLGIHNGREKS